MHKSKLNIINIIKRRRLAGWGLSRIFRSLRKYKEFENLGDYPLAMRIVSYLRENGFIDHPKKITDKEIYGLFDQISVYDYLQVEKRRLLKNLREVGL